MHGHTVVTVFVNSADHNDHQAQNGPKRNKTCFRGFANNKGADQPAHMPRPISAFVFRLLESIISRVATSEISIF